jgi:hypothetical protein
MGTLTKLTKLGDATHKKLIEYAYKPPNQSRVFVPNPGSQSQVLFDLMGCDRGDKHIIDYKDGSTGEAFEVIPKPYQNEFDFICYTAGNGTGKSKLGSFYVYLRSILYPNTKGLITANDYTQLRASTLVALAEFCAEYDIDLRPIRSTPEETASSIAASKQCWINGQHHLVLSAQAFLGETPKAKQAGRGFTVGHIWADEWLRLHSASAFNTALTRLRAAGCKPLGLITSTINTDNPYGWDWDLFESPDRSEDAKRLFIAVSGATHENRHNLDTGYIPRLKASLSPELYDIEVLGKRVRITIGRIAKYFNRDRHVLSIPLDRAKALHVSLDFNHNPSTGIICQFNEVERELYVLREFYLTNSNTFELSDAIAQWLTDKQITTAVYLHGDASGAQKTANSKKTNWQIVTERLRPWHPAQRYGRANPEVMDTINSLNAAFSHDRIYLDKTCKELIKDLEFLRFDDNGGIDKKTDLMRSHLFDELRYVTHDLLSIVDRRDLGVGVANYR